MYAADERFEKQKDFMEEVKRGANKWRQSQTEVAISDPFNRDKRKDEEYKTYLMHTKGGEKMCINIKDTMRKRKEQEYIYHENGNKKEITLTNIQQKVLWKEWRQFKS